MAVQRRAASKYAGLTLDGDHIGYTVSVDGDSLRTACNNWKGFVISGS